MAFPDIGQDHEINNELLLFRELFHTRSKYRNSLLISQGGRITQHLVEFSANNKGLITYDIYKEDFEIFLEKCEFIPKAIRVIILQFYDFRKNVDYSLEYEKELKNVMAPYLETFYNILDWFEIFFRLEFYDEKKKFEEITKTKDTLNKQINKLKKQNQTDSTHEETDTYDDFKENYQNIEDVLDKIKSTYPEVYYLLNYFLEDSKKAKQDREKILQNQKREHEEHITQSEQLNTIEDKIDYLTEYLKDYNADLAKFRKDIQTKLEDAKDNDDRKEKIYTKFNNDSAVKLRNSVEDHADKDEYDIEEEKVKDNLGRSAWNKLEKDSQKFLVTSEITYNHLCDLGNKVDYSGVCLSVTKALEIELKKRFYQGFIDYLDANYDYKEYHSSFFNKDIIQKGNFKKKTKWTLGGIPHMLGSHPDCKKLEYEIRENNKSKLIEYSKYALFDPEKHDDDYIEETLRKYGSEINSITDKYRNKAAHTKKIKDTKAKQCLDYVIDVTRFLGTMLDSFDKENAD